MNLLKTRIMDQQQTASVGKPVRWWEIALLTIAVTALSRIATGRSPKNNRDVYRQKTKQPAWAPPGWVFAPAWTLNNVFVLRALLQLLKNGRDMPRQKQLLLLQALIWGLFLSFGYVYFKKRSTILGGIWTVADAVCSGMSFLIAHKVNKPLANNYLPIMAWTTFASTVAIPQALQNPDKWLGTRALLN